MIIKKPYAFLIKYFRIIHLVLFVPMAYLILKTRNIVAFFRNFVANNYSTNLVNIVSKYINVTMYLSIILIIVSVIAIFYLMKQKNKSTKLYISIIAYYSILFILIIVSHNILANLEQDIISAQAARAYRDISQVVVLPQYFFAIYMIIRGIGFDIKQFNFANDLKDLEISDSDREEVELSINLESYRVKRTLHRFIREFKYYVKENLFIFSCIGLVVFILLGRFLYINLIVNNRTYVITDNMNHKNFSININDSIVTNLGYDGTIITPGKYFLVLKLNIKNNSNTAYELDYNNFRLVINNENIYPTLDRGHYFLDLGKAYQKQKIKGQTEETYVLAYELNEKQLLENYTIHVLDSIIYNEDKVESNYKKINLKPKQITKIQEEATLDLNKILTLNNSTLGYTTLQISSYSISNSYINEYNRCQSENNCQKIKEKITANLDSTSKKTLLILNAIYNNDKTTKYYEANRDFFNDFVGVRYKINDEIKIAKVNNRTTTNMENVYILETDAEINQAEDIELIVTVRNLRYTMKLK